MPIAQGPWKHEPRRDTYETRPFTPADWHGSRAPAYAWVVDGALLAGTVAMLSGDGGLGKSLLTQQLCTAAALGRPWLGMGTRRLRSVAVFCEDDQEELHRRQERINAHYGCQMDELTDVEYWARPGLESVMVRFDRWGAEPKVTPLFEQVKRRCLDMGAQLLVLDTRRSIFRGNEIDYGQAAATISLFRRLAIELQGVVVLTDHPSNEGISSGSGMSGNRAWSNSVRSRLYLTEPKRREGETERVNDRVLRVAKSNYAPKGKLELQYRAGVFVRVDAPASGDQWWSER